MFDRELAAKAYDVVLFGNKTIAKHMQVLYTNTSPNKPLENTIGDTSSLGTYIGLSLLEKTQGSHGYASLGINNPNAEFANMIRNQFDRLSPEEKEESLPKILGWYHGMLDNETY